MIVSFFTDNLIIQMAVFVVSSIVLIFLTKPFVKKFIEKNDNLATNAYSIIGKKGRVTEEINSETGSGQIKVGAETWSAKPLEDNTIIPKDSNVIIEKIDGVKAVVSVSSKDKTKTI